MERRTQRADTGFAVIQALIVFAIAGVIAAVAIPVYAMKAKDSVLQQNSASLVLQVKGCVALDLDPVYVADDQVADDHGAPTSVSTAIARALLACDTGSRGHYVNPLSGSGVVLCQSALPTSASELRPAVWITSDQRYVYSAFRPSAATESQLAGTLLVVFTTSGGRPSGIDIFFVDGAGQRSPAATSLAL